MNKTKTLKETIDAMLEAVPLDYLEEINKNAEEITNTAKFGAEVKTVDGVIKYFAQEFAAREQVSTAYFKAFLHEFERLNHRIEQLEKKIK